MQQSGSQEKGFWFTGKVFYKDLSRYQIKIYKKWQQKVKNLEKIDYVPLTTNLESGHFPITKSKK